MINPAKVSALQLRSVSLVAVPAMASESPQVERTPPQTGPGDQPATPAADTAKRKADQNHGTQRTKRNRYISIACNECKRRKIKCNGQVPCQRCGHLNLECRYAPNCCSNNFKESEEFKSMTDQLSTLQEQVNSLFSSMNELRSHKPSFESPTFDHVSRDDSQPVFTSIPASLAKPRIRHPRFHGPTSSAFNFDVAKSSLQNMGITPTEDGPDDLSTAHVSPAGSPPPHLGPLVQTIHPSKDPIWTIPRQEAIRLLRVYEEEIGMTYPVVTITSVVHQANLLYTFIEAATRTGFAQRGLPGDDGLLDDSTILLKLILATTLVVEGGGQSELGQRLYLSVKPVIESKLWEPHDIKNIQLYAIVATYHFHTDDDAMAYRIIGIAGRMSLEMGLNRRDALMKAFPNDQWREVNRIFWTVYSLDRRWSLGMGLPFVIQDEDIDSKLPEPVRPWYYSTCNAYFTNLPDSQDESLPYLRCMIAYNRISQKVVYSGGSERLYFDFRVLEWWKKQVPEELKFSPVEPNNGEPVSRGMRRLRVLLYLRMNQLRILIYRPVLHSPASIVEDRGHAQTVVDVAKDTVRVLTRLNQVSDIYRTQQITFNYFLVAALAVLLLAVAHAPADFNQQVHDEFYMALDLIKGFSTKSYVSKRLWKTIKGLREIGEKLGVMARPFGADNDPHSAAAVTMAGLAGHSIDDLSYGPMNGVNELGSSPLNGIQMSDELTNLFEAVGAFGSSFIPPGDSINGFVGEGEIQNTGEGLSGVLGDEGEFARVIQDLF
ncbi:hypothetical protein NUU61_009717 [Penicillium alfredii]|uniref:Zn(2)-C6 fungal-type domain-containing protein n=1 Tax=Penicillium alfredii TaxID=1506179 RepID=A0A9W9EGM8_9EURO|nr:uncharacterized protein NUU61_009717 [Penicillium alfredii]KAJ5081453.1 hypothetical protein NUU61_009717 [Penicillium alfredii]